MFSFLFYAALLAAFFISEEEARVREVARTDPQNAAAWARLAEIAEKKGRTKKSGGLSSESLGT